MWRIIALVIHWMALVTLIATVKTTVHTEELVVFSFIGIVITSLLLTRTLLSSVQVIVQGSNQEKAKRELQAGTLDVRTQLLLSLLSEDERARVRQRLMTDTSDGEAIAIDDLLYDRQNHGSVN